MYSPSTNRDPPKILRSQKGFRFHGGSCCLLQPYLGGQNLRGFDFTPLPDYALPLAPLPKTP